MLYIYIYNTTYISPTPYIYISYIRYFFRKAVDVGDRNLLWRLWMRLRCRNVVQKCHCQWKRVERWLSQYYFLYVKRTTLFLKILKSKFMFSFWKVEWLRRRIFFWEWANEINILVVYERKWKESVGTNCLHMPICYEWWIVLSDYWNV